MNENYLRALEGLEELKGITFSKENINKRLGLETFKIDRELLKDEQITSTFSSTEINLLISVLENVLPLYFLCHSDWSSFAVLY